MIREPNYLLGVAFSLLTQVRDYLIRGEDVQGIEIIEDQYQKLTKAIEETVYKDVKHEK